MSNEMISVLKWLDEEITKIEADMEPLKIKLEYLKQRKAETECQLNQKTANVIVEANLLGDKKISDKKTSIPTAVIAILQNAGKSLSTKEIYEQREAFGLSKDLKHFSVLSAISRMKKAEKLEKDKGKWRLKKNSSKANKEEEN